MGRSVTTLMYRHSKEEFRRWFKEQDIRGIKYTRHYKKGDYYMAIYITRDGRLNMIFRRYDRDMRGFVPVCMGESKALEEAFMPRIKKYESDFKELLK